MQILRTPDRCFDNLPGYNFTPHYEEIAAEDGSSLRIHYLDEGPADATETLLCIHGQPSWCYLYRKMIPLLTAAGHRVICPDLVGFGRSDKPAEREDYTYQRHVDWMSTWLQQLDLSNLTLVCQDWGGLIGLRLVTAHPDRFARVVVANTGLPDGHAPDGSEIPAEMAPVMREVYDSLPVVEMHELGEKFLARDGPPGFFYWRKYTAENPGFHPRDVFANSLGLQDLSEAEREAILDAYAAPFPDSSYIAGARQFPSLVPIFPDDPSIPANRAAWEVLQRFDKPVLTAFSDSDPVTAGGEKRFQKTVPGAAGVQHATITGAGHFLQEDQPQQLSDAILRFIRQH